MLAVGAWQRARTHKTAKSVMVRKIHLTRPGAMAPVQPWRRPLWGYAFSRPYVVALS